MRTRLLLSYLSITLFVLVALEVPLGLQFARQERDNLTADLEHDAYALALRTEESLEQFDDGDPQARASLQAVADEYGRDTGARTVIVGADGVSLADSDPPPGVSKAERRDFATRPEFEAALRGDDATGSRHSDTLDSDLLYVAVPVASGGALHGAVRVSYPLSVVNDRIRRNWLLLAGVGGVVLLIVLAASVALAQSVIRPVRELEKAADRLGQGDLRTRVPVPAGPAELRVLAESFNQTATQLEQLVDAQQAFVADASHQLRTPLAALRLRLENLESDVGHLEDLDGALDEVQRLAHLVEGLLALSRAEYTTPRPEPIDLRGAVEARRAAWTDLAAERGVHIENNVDRGLAVSATPEPLMQVIDNLLDNALEYAPSGTSVAVGAVSEPSRTVLTIADAGPGMTDEERARAFDRFWRSPSAPRDDGGSGLGLAIARRLVRADGGEMELVESPSGGLEVDVWLRPAPRAIVGGRRDG